jgi:hypothetical protein
MWAKNCVHGCDAVADVAAGYRGNDITSTSLVEDRNPHNPYGWQKDDQDSEETSRRSLETRR